MRVHFFQRMEQSHTIDFRHHHIREDHRDFIS